MSQFRNLVFEGGGVKGIAYAGAIQVLEDKGILSDIRRVAGTSAGAITAALLALGAKGQDVRDIVGRTDFRRFMDDSWCVLSDIRRLLKRFGWYKGDAFAEWMRQQIGALAEGHEDITFRELAGRAAARAADEPPKYRELFVPASDLSTQRAEVLSARTAPGVPIWQAVRMSMSIPLFFACARRAGNVMVDGGVTWNYPIDLFDRLEYLSAEKNGATYIIPKYPTTYGDDHVYNKETLGFRVDTSDEIKAKKDAETMPPKPVKNLFDYAWVLLGFMMETANNAHLHQNDWHRTVFIEADGVRFTDFDLRKKEIDRLVANGQRCTREYFEWFDHPEPGDEPINKVRLSQTPAP